MRFEISEKIRTDKPRAQIFAALQEQFAKVSKNVTIDDGRIKVAYIEASFGSINRKDESVVAIKPLDDGYLLIADVVYKPSVAFWIILILTLFSGVAWLLPLGFYFWQKRVVTQAIKNCFERIKNEFEQSGPIIRSSPEQDTLAALKEISALKAQGVITQEEYDLKKKALLMAIGAFKDGGGARPQPSSQAESAGSTAAIGAPEAARPPTPPPPAPAVTPSPSTANFAHEIPPGVKGWSWGAFFLSFVWAIPNKTWIGLLALVPLIGLPVPFVLGFKGREWAWRNRRWDSVAQFNAVQRKWSIWGSVFYAVCLTIVVGNAGYQKFEVRREQQRIADNASSGLTAYLSAPPQSAPVKQTPMPEVAAATSKPADVPSDPSPALSPDAAVAAPITIAEAPKAANQPTWGPSFDCSKASTFAERAICSDSLLGKLDGLLSENFRDMLASNIGDGARSDLKATQRKWFSERSKCTDNQCLANIYRKRIGDVCDYPVITGVHPVCPSAEGL